MNPKENPDHRAEGLLQSSFTSTKGQSTSQPPKASEKAAQAQKREPRGGTQIATVQELLRSRAGGFVGMNEIMREGRCAAAHSTISTLQHKYGFTIRDRMSRPQGDIVLSEYQLEEGEA
ncbi:hypothetical protein N8490_01500 [bacterium]|nr:hypothetical protein [bacterium]